VTNPWSENVSKAFEVNTKATYALMQALNNDDLSRVIRCEFGFKIWNNWLPHLKEPLKLRDLEINLLTSQYEISKMHENESVDDMLNHFSKIINGLIF